MSHSIIEQLATAKPEERAAYIEQLDPDELQLLLDRDWSVVGRPEQFIPADEFFLWFIRAGRGWGKTRAGAEGTKDRLQWITRQLPEGDTARWALMGQRDRDVRLTMYEGETGLRRFIPDSWIPQGWERALNRSALTLELLIDGVPAFLQGFSARTPDAPRGPQFHGGWVDEPGSFPDAHLGLAEDTAFSNLLFGMRLNPFGGLIVTGTPRNNRLIRELRALDGIIETHGRTRENLHNLADVFKRTVVARYLGTRLGRQELDAEILEGVGVMFQRGWFKLTDRPPWPEGTSTRTVRYWDLASGEESDANPDPDFTAGARVTMDPSRRLYLIEHIERFRLRPGARELRIREVARTDGLKAQWIEKDPGNAGGALLLAIGRELDELNIAVKGNPVSGSKEVRAEPVAAAAEQGRVWLMEGPHVLPLLDEAEEFPAGGHDDQIDALSGAFAVLKGARKAEILAAPAAQQVPRTAGRGPAAGMAIPRPGARQR
jgi:predicted phage terminase large subunit-like protein